MSLSAWLDARGARRGPGGRVRHLADPGRETRAALEGAALLVREGWRVVRVAGNDAAGYLHRMTSQDVVGLAPGRAAWALVLTSKGKILGDPWIWHVADGWLLDLDPRAGDATLSTLERYVIADDVSFSDETDASARLLLLGRETSRALAAAGLPRPDPGHVADATLDGVAMRLLGRAFGSTFAVEVLAPAEAGEALAEALLRGTGASLVGEDALDALRARERVPAFGAELGPETMPLEARLDDLAISWKKGCYPGQEPVAMAKYRGRPPHLLARVRLVGADGGPGRRLLKDGRDAGRVTTVSAVNEAEGVLALALVRTAFADEETTFEVEGGGTARTLPG